MSRRLQWLILTAGAGAAASFATKWSLRKAWSAATDEPAPDGRRDAPTRDLALWVAAAGAAAGGAAVLARRGVREWWVEVLERPLPSEES